MCFYLWCFVTAVACLEWGVNASQHLQGINSPFKLLFVSTSGVLLRPWRALNGELMPCRCCEEDGLVLVDDEGDEN